MNNKIIITIKDDIENKVALKMIGMVVDEGFLSGEKQYCRATRFSDGNSVITRKTKNNTHSFIVCKDNNKYEQLDYLD